MKHQFSRRAALVGIGAIAATPALAEECRIGPAPHDKGPLVWMDMDQVELDAAYDQSFYAPLGGQIRRRWASTSDSVRERLGAPLRQAYGPTRGREARHLSHQEAERADLRLHSRRRLARRRGEGLRLSGGAVRQCRRPLRRARLHRRQGGERRPWRDGGSGAPRRRLGLQECGELWRRSEPALCRRPFVRRALCGVTLVTDWSKDSGCPTTSSKAACA